jgi:hypothetical protein
MTHEDDDYYMRREGFCDFAVLPQDLRTGGDLEGQADLKVRPTEIT